MSRNADSHWLTTAEAADRLGLSRRTLEGYRTKGGGPRFHKANPSSHSSPVRYLAQEVDEWMGVSLQSTSDMDAA